MKNKFTLKLREKSIDTCVSIKTTITNHISYSFNPASNSKIYCKIVSILTTPFISLQSHYFMQTPGDKQRKVKTEIIIVYNLNSLKHYF